MTGGKGLAQGAGVVGLHTLVGHALDSGVTDLIHLPRLLLHLFYLIFLGIYLYLYFIEYTPEVLVQLGVQDRAYMRKSETFLYGLLGNPYPGDIPLPDVHQALGIV